MLTSGPSELETPSPWKPLRSDLHRARLLHHSSPGSYDLPPEMPSAITPSKTWPSRAFSCSFHSSFLNPQLTHVHLSLVYPPTKTSAQLTHRPPPLYPPHYFQCLPWNRAHNNSQKLYVEQLLSQHRFSLTWQKLQPNCASVPGPGLHPVGSHSSGCFSFLLTPLRIQFNVTGTWLCLLPYIY